MCHKKQLLRLTFWSRFSEAQRVDLDMETFHTETEAEKRRDAEQHERDDPSWLKLLKTFCCVAQKSVPNTSGCDEAIGEVQMRENNMISVREKKSKSRLANANALVLMVRLPLDR